MRSTEDRTPAPPATVAELLDDVTYWAKLARKATRGRDKAMLTAKRVGASEPAIAEAAGYASRGTVWRRIEAAKRAEAEIQ